MKLNFHKSTPTIGKQCRAHTQGSVTVKITNLS